MDLGYNPRRPVYSQHQLEKAAIYQVEGLTVRDEPNEEQLEREIAPDSGTHGQFDRDIVDTTPRAVRTAEVTMKNLVEFIGKENSDGHRDDFKELKELVQNSYKAKETAMEDYVRCTKDLHNAKDGLAILAKAIKENYSAIKKMDFFEADAIFTTYRKAKSFLSKQVANSETYRSRLWNDFESQKQFFYDVNNGYKEVKEMRYELDPAELNSLDRLEEFEMDQFTGTGFGSFSYDMGWFKDSAPTIYNLYANRQDGVELGSTEQEQFDNREKEWGGHYRLKATRRGVPRSSKRGERSSYSDIKKLQKAQWREYFRVTGGMRAASANNKRSLEVAQKTLGTAVIHPKFGRGTIVGIKLRKTGDKVIDGQSVYFVGSRAKVLNHYKTVEAYNAVWMTVKFQKDVITILSSFLKPAKASQPAKAETSSVPF